MIAQLFRRPRNELSAVEQHQLIWRLNVTLASVSFVLGIVQFFIIPRNGGASEVLLVLGGIMAVAALISACYVIFPREPARAWSFADARCISVIALLSTAVSFALLIITLVFF